MRGAFVLLSGWWQRRNVTSSNQRGDTRREFCQEVVAFNHAPEIDERCAARQRWAGGNGGKIVAVDIGNIEGDLLRSWRSSSQSPAFHRRKMTPHDVHFVDHCAAIDQRAVDGLRIF